MCWNIHRVAGTQETQFFSFNRQWQIALQNDSSTFTPAMNASTDFIPFTSKLTIMALTLFCYHFDKNVISFYLLFP